MTVTEGDLIKITEEWVKEDPRWEAFHQGTGNRWDLRFTIMDDGVDEQICWESKTIWLAMYRRPDPLFRMTHAIGHVMEHYGAESFTREQCARANKFAKWWLRRDVAA
jgi:hypothetical protein